MERVQVEIVEGGFENGGLVVVELDHGISSGDHAEERKNHVMALEEHGGQGLGNGEFVVVEQNGHGMEIGVVLVEEQEGFGLGNDGNKCWLLIH